MDASSTIIIRPSKSSRCLINTPLVINVTYSITLSTRISIPGAVSILKESTANAAIMQAQSGIDIGDTFTTRVGDAGCYVVVIHTVTPLMYENASQFSSVGTCRTRSVKVDISIEVGIASRVDIHVGLQFALKPSVARQAASCNLDNSVELVKARSRRMSIRSSSKSGCAAIGCCTNRHTAPVNTVGLSQFGNSIGNMTSVSGTAKISHFHIRSSKHGGLRSGQCIISAAISSSTAHRHEGHGPSILQTSPFVDLIIGERENISNGLKVVNSIFEREDLTRNSVDDGFHLFNILTLEHGADLPYKSVGIARGKLGTEGGGVQISLGSCDNLKFGFTCDVVCHHESGLDGHGLVGLLCGNPGLYVEVLVNVAPHLETDVDQVAAFDGGGGTGSNDGYVLEQTAHGDLDSVAVFAVDGMADVREGRRRGIEEIV